MRAKELAKYLRSLADDLDCVPMSCTGLEPGFLAEVFANLTAAYPYVRIAMEIDRHAGDPMATVTWSLVAGDISVRASSLREAYIQFVRHGDDVSVIKAVEADLSM